MLRTAFGFWEEEMAELRFIADDRGHGSFAPLKDFHHCKVMV